MGLASQNELWSKTCGMCEKHESIMVYVDDSVVSDDSVYVLTKMDPNYPFASVLESIRETDSWNLKPLVKLDSDG